MKSSSIYSSTSASLLLFLERLGGEEAGGEEACREEEEVGEARNLFDANFLLFDIIFHMAEVGFWSKVPFFGDPHPQCLWQSKINVVLL